MNKRLLITSASGAVIILGTVFAIRFAQGYRPTTKGTIVETGLLAANSFPNGASVYINGDLRSATDTTLNLSPGEYDIEIKKDGFTPWRKTMRLEKELVAQTNALLFPVAPSLSALTVTGAQNITPSPDGQRLLFTTASASTARANGIYVLDLTDSPLALQKGPRQISQTPTGWDMKKATFFWSPDAEQILVEYGNRSYLLSSTRLTTLESAEDITARKTQLVREWNIQTERKHKQALSRFPQEVVDIATGSARAMYISPDQERMLYTATASATIPDNLIPAVQAANTQPQARTVTPGNTYVYDRHEDRNFLVASAPLPLATISPTTTPGKRTTAQPSPAPNIAVTQLTETERLLHQMQQQSSGFFTNSPQWLPDSKHIIVAYNSTIEITEYDGTNRTRIYSGPLFENFVYPWPNGSKLIILTNFNQPEGLQHNLYAVSLK